jgi:hypothetical protein
VASEKRYIDRMGRTRGIYNAEFPEGTLIRVVGRPQLEEFMRVWCFHHPLTEDQPVYAGMEGRVVDVGFYHGGDELYQVEGIQGIWHESCLERAALG